MNRGCNAVIRMLHYVFVNNGNRDSMHANGTLYLGPRCVFLRTQIQKKGIRELLLKITGWGNWTNGRDVNPVSLSGGRPINKGIMQYQPAATLIYISWIAVTTACGMDLCAAGTTGL